jgi:hypothetical protein
MSGYVIACVMCVVYELDCLLILDSSMAHKKNTSRNEEMYCARRHCLQSDVYICALHPTALFSIGCGYMRRLSCRS